MPGSRTRRCGWCAGTVQADILKEDQAQNTCIFSTEFALRMMGDIHPGSSNQVRNFYSVSISGYHMAEAGANPITQLAFTLANGFTFVEYYLARGMDIDDFAPNLSFFFSNGIDPEYAVIGRVARRIWARAMRNLYGGNERSQMLKYHIQTSGRSLHAQEIGFNDIRTTLQALYAIYDNTNSLHTNAYDEAITTPTEESVRRAMAIQLIINRELGLAKNENPLQGSFIIEELTDLVEEAVYLEFERLNDRGGVLGAMERQYQRMKIQEESLYYERLKESGNSPSSASTPSSAPTAHRSSSPKRSSAPPTKPRTARSPTSVPSRPATPTTPPPPSTPSRPPPSRAPTSSTPSWTPPRSLPSARCPTPSTKSAANTDGACEGIRSVPTRPEAVWGDRPGGAGPTRGPVHRGRPPSASPAAPPLPPLSLRSWGEKLREGAVRETNSWTSPPRTAPLGVACGSATPPTVASLLGGETERRGRCAKRTRGPVHRGRPPSASPAAPPLPPLSLRSWGEKLREGAVRETNPWTSPPRTAPLGVACGSATPPTVASLLGGETERGGGARSEDHARNSCGGPDSDR
jgi:hypothetical protein